MRNFYMLVLFILIGCEAEVSVVSKNKETKKETISVVDETLQYPKGYN